MTGSTPKHTLPTFVLVLAGVILLRHGTSTIASSSCAVAFVSMSSSSSFSHNLQQSFPRALPFRNSNNDDDKVNRPQNNLDNGEQSTPLPLKVPSSSSSSSSSWLFQQQQQQSRQGFFQSALSNAVAAALGVSTTTASSSSFCQPAWARGLVQFPAPLLANTYHFMHAGTSLLEEEGKWWICLLLVFY